MSVEPTVVLGEGARQLPLENIVVAGRISGPDASKLLKSLQEDRPALAEKPDDMATEELARLRIAMEEAQEEERAVECFSPSIRTSAKAAVAAA